MGVFDRLVNLGKGTLATHRKGEARQRAAADLDAELAQRPPRRARPEEPPPPPEPARDGRLARLHELRESGLLTREEFDDKAAEILAEGREE